MVPQEELLRNCAKDTGEGSLSHGPLSLLVQVCSGGVLTVDTRTFVCVHAHSCAPVQTHVCVNVVDWLLQAPGGRTQREGSTGKKRGSRLQQSTAAAIVPAV